MLAAIVQPFRRRRRRRRRYIVLDILCRHKVGRSPDLFVSAPRAYLSA